MKFITAVTGVLFLGLAQNPAFSGEGVIFNDATTQLNPVKVYKIVKVQDLNDIRRALEEARSKGLKISIAGKRHAQGGQQSYPNGIVLDMMGFNRIISLDKENKTIRVQSGVVWRQVQDYIRPYGYAVSVMQVNDIFTVGGSLSSNIHGDDPNYSSIIETVKSFHLMLADGRVINVSRQENPELFSLVIGGYGLFGIIIDADLLLTDNVIYKRTAVRMDYTQYPEFFRSRVLNNDQIGEEFAYLSKSKQGQGYDQVLRVETYFRAPMAEGALAKLPPDVRKRYKYRIDCTGYDPFTFKGGGKDLLQEYFIPVDKFVFFMDGLRGILKSFTDATPPVVRIRYVKQDKQSFLPYAKADSFAVDLDIDIGQSLSPQGFKDVQNLTRQIVDLSLSCGGTFYLTKIGIYPDRGQLLKAYPEFDEFIRKKKKYDPQEIFVNQFYDHYR